MDIREVGDQLEPELRSAFLAAVDAASNLVSEAELVKVIAEGPAALEALASRLVISGFIPAAEPFVNILRIIASAASLTVRGNFDRVSSFAIDAIRDHAFKLVRGLATETTETVRGVLLDGYQRGIGAPAMARQIRDHIGLLPAHRLAVGRYHDSMVMAEVNPELIARNTATYARRLLAWRADMVARTETMVAAHTGLVAGWRANLGSGLLRTTVRMRWQTTEDDRLCERCAPMDGQLQKIGDEFVSMVKGFPDGLPTQPSKKRRRIGGPRPGSRRNPLRQESLDGRTVPLVRALHVLHPPLHPACRCTLTLEFDTP